MTSYVIQDASLAATHLIAFWEKFRNLPYFATKEESLRGLLTIGYGFTEIGGYPIRSTMVMSKKVALHYLEEKINALEWKLTPYCQGMNPGQLAACISLAYNIGLSAFLKSTLLRKWKESLTPQGSDIEVEEISKEFIRWNKQNKVVLSGLTKRRKMEKDVFLYGILPEEVLHGLD